MGSPILNTNPSKSKKLLKKYQYVGKPSLNKNSCKNQFFYKNFTFSKNLSLNPTYSKKTTNLVNLLLRYSVTVSLIIMATLAAIYFVFSTQVYTGGWAQHEVLITNYLSNSSFENFGVNLSSVF